VVANAKFYGLGVNYPMYYHSYDQMVSWTGGFGARSMSLLIRTRNDPLALAGPVREAVRATDPDLPIAWMRTLDDIASESVSQPRFLMTLLAVFGGAALALAAIGVYGVISHSVAQRTNEVGIRMALGAASTTVTGMIVRQGMGLALLGIIAGVVASIVASRLLTGFLFNVQSTDPMTFVSVVGVIFIVVLLACYIPARRASRVDPLVALRTE
jgi:ABC-type antimicrobial peptide transport system permease subunit